MDIASPTLIATLLGATALAALVPKAAQRLALSRAKHPSLAGHVRMAKRIAGWLPSYDFDESNFFRSDDATGEVAERRRIAFRRLSQDLRDRSEATRRLTTAAAAGISDLQFTDRYRVPFPYRRLVSEALPLGTFVKSSDGPRLTDLDGNVAYDVSGSYGVNLFGYEFYKRALAEAEHEGRALGPVLGPYHPVVADNVARLRAISGLDEVSFHMSGTEAVMQAVRLARYHTGRRRIVRFCGAYHGWWGDVQPGIGNPIPARDTLTLADMSERTLAVLASRRDIACVLVNPLQALHPNSGAPADSALVDSSRRAGFDRAAYTDWLQRLRDVCSKRGIVLILDEIFVGFRLAAGGAQEYFGVKADLVTYGKSLGGGLPVGVLCGKADLMRRFREGSPGDICFARGTFNSHPYVMTAMNAFLRHLETPEVRTLYEGLDQCWTRRTAELNARLADERLPIRVANLASIWTVLYERPSRYNWMFQYYLRAEGLALSWVGTGRLIFSLDYGEAEYADVMDRFAAAARRMERDGWWSGGLATNKAIKRRILRETVAALLGRPLPGVAKPQPRGGEEFRPATTP